MYAVKTLLQHADVSFPNEINAAAAFLSGCNAPGSFSDGTAVGNPATGEVFNALWRH